MDLLHQIRGQGIVCFICLFLKFYNENIIFKNSSVPEKKKVNGKKEDVRKKVEVKDSIQ